MRLLLASPYLHPGGGGLERYAAAMARGLVRDGHEVTLLGHAPAPLDELHEGVRYVGVVAGARLSNTPIGLDVARAARRLMRETEPHLVNVHTPVPGTAELVAWVATRERAPFAVTYHAGRLEGPGLLHAAARLHRWSGERWLLARASARLAVSPYVARRVFGGRVSAVVPPGVDAERFRPVAPSVPGRILFVGPVDRAYAWKGLPVLFEAFRRLAPTIPDATLRVVGRGDLVETYERRAREAGLASRFSIVPRVSDDGLVREYSQAQVVVLPSTSPAESFGMVLAEANACERAVVGSDVGGIPSFVRSGDNGLLARAGDAAALADAIATLLRDEDRAAEMGRAGRRRVLREHRWPDLARRTAEVLTAASSRGA